MTAGAADRLLADLDEAQREAVTSGGQPLVVLAGAGSGKTRVLTRRIAWRCATGSADPRHVLAITFTRKAAGELRHRLLDLGAAAVTAGTFHSVALAQLRQRDADAGRRSPEILDRKARLLGGLLSRAGIRRPGATPAFDMAAEIEWAKARMISPDRYVAEAARAGRSTSLEPAAVADVFDRYEEEKRHRGLADFDDLLISCADALENDAEWAAAQRWRWRHFFVDEYQDVNPLQIRLLAAWRGDRPDLCVVGDPDQSIYSWNGAEASELPTFADRHPGTTVVRLRANYRCPAPVLAAARAALGPVGKSEPLPARQAGSPAPVDIRGFDDAAAEAAGIAEILRGRHVARRWSDEAVLVRTNAQAIPIQRALSAAGVPCRVRGGGLLREPEVRDALSSLRRQGGLDEWTDATEAAAREAAPERAANLEALVTLAREFRALDPGGAGPAFLTWLSDAAGDEAAGGPQDAVEISSFHRAKGLEWDVVVVAGVEDGYVPHYLSEADEALAEERRLLYVACTRASSDLILTWARRRAFGSNERRREPSPWLAPIEALDGKRRPAVSARPQPGQRPPRAPAGVDAADADLYEALRNWRLGVSRSSNVPAYVVFADATLAAIAAARPRDTRSLLRLPGVGPVKIDRFGQQVLDVVASHHRAS